VINKENAMKILAFVTFFAMTISIVFGEEISPLYPIKLGEKYGYIDVNGKMIVEPLFDEAEQFDDDGFAKVKVNKLYGYIAQDGSFQVQPKYEEIGYFEKEGLRIVSLLGKKGFINKQKQLVIEPKFDKAEDFLNGTAPVVIGDKCGFVDKNGDFVMTIKSKCNDIYHPDSENLVGFILDDKVGWADGKGSVVIEPKIPGSLLNKSSTESHGTHKFGFFEGIATIIGSDVFKQTYVDTSGKIIRNVSDAMRVNHLFMMILVTDKEKEGCYNILTGEKKYDSCLDFDFGIAVLVGGLWGFVNDKDNIIIEPKFEDIHSYGTNLYPAKISGKWGAIDKTGNFIIQPEFDDVRMNSSSDLILVKKNKKFGYVDSKGNMKITPKFDSATDFHDGLAKVELDGFIGFVNENGEYLIKPRFDKTEYDIEDKFVHHLVLFNKDGWNKGYINKSGKVITRVHWMCGQAVLTDNQYNATYPGNIKEICNQYIKAQATIPKEKKEKCSHIKIGEKFGHGGGIFGSETILGFTQDYKVVLGESGALRGGNIETKDCSEIKKK